MHKQSQIKIKHSHTETKGQHMYVVRPNLGVTSTNQLCHVILILKRAYYKQQQLCCLHIFRFTFEILLTKHFITPTTNLNEQSFQGEARVTSYAR